MIKFCVLYTEVSNSNTNSSLLLHANHNIPLPNPEQSKNPLHRITGRRAQTACMFARVYHVILHGDGERIWSDMDVGPWQWCTCPVSVQSAWRRQRRIVVVTDTGIHLQRSSASASIQRSACRAAADDRQRPSVASPMAPARPAALLAAPRSDLTLHILKTIWYFGCGVKRNGMFWSWKRETGQYATVCRPVWDKLPVLFDNLYSPYNGSKREKEKKNLN